MTEDKPKQESSSKQIEWYVTPNGREPCKEWLETLDNTVEARIRSYLARLAEGGSSKNLKSVGAGVFEVKINTGPGYRVYFAEVGGKMILLLIGGDKKTQFMDIIQAKKYWSEYETRKKL